MIGHIGGWNNDCSLYARVQSTSQQNNSIQILNQSNKIQNEMSLPFQLDSSFTCLQWVQQQSSSTQKKRKTNNNNKENGITSEGELIVGGTSNGKVIVFDVNTNEVSTQKQLKKKQAIVQIVQNEESNQLFVLTKDTIHLYNITTNQFTPIKFKNHSSGKVEMKCLYTLNEYVVVGSNDGSLQFCQFNPSNNDFVLLYKFAAHSNMISHVHLLSENQSNTSFAMYTASTDRYCNLYKLKYKNNKWSHSLMTSITLENAPIRMDFVSYMKENYLVELNSNYNKCKLFHVDHKKRTKSTNALTSIHISPSADNEKKYNKMDDKILDVKLHVKSSNILEVYLLKGNRFSSNIEKVSIENQKFPSELALQQNKAKQAPTKKTQTTDSVLLGPTNMENTSARMKQAYATESDILNSKIKPDIQSNLNKIQTLNIQQFISNIEQAKKEQESDKNTPQIQFSSSLIQALKSSDNHAIDKCLNQNDKDLIHITVNQLPSEFCVPLLESILNRFQGNSIQISCLVDWIQALFTYHTSYLMVQKNLLARLSPIYHSINHRISTFQPLMDLSGRLDLLLSIGGYSLSNIEGKDDFESVIVESKEQHEEDSDEEDEQHLGEEEEMNGEEEENDSNEEENNMEEDSEDEN